MPAREPGAEGSPPAGPARARRCAITNLSDGLVGRGRARRSPVAHALQRLVHALASCWEKARGNEQLIQARTSTVPVRYR